MSAKQLLLAIFTSLIFLPPITSAHHSRSEFSKEVSEIEGELMKVHWKNPHAGLDIKTTNPDGTEETWRVETYGSPNLFGRMGVKRKHFVVGERITVAGNISERRPRYILGSNALFQNGKEAVLSATIEPRWSQDHVGGAAHSDVDLSQLVDAAGENKGIFRVWSIAGRAVGTKRHFPYTNETRAQMMVWDPVTAPVARCEAPGMPGPMYQPLSFVISDQGDTVNLITEYFGTDRTIHVGKDPAAAETQAASPLGYSVGRWEGNTFVVETSRINYPYVNSAGAKQSENVKVSETFALSEDQTELAYRIEINDYTTFTEQAYSERLYVALGAEFIELDCTVF